MASFQSEPRSEGPFDVIIIGAGPAGLAVLSSLQTPSGILTEAQRSHARRGKTLERRLSVCVVDPSGAWMREWKGRFEALDITFLRSPAFASPDAFSESALVDYAWRVERMDELRPLELAANQKLPGSNRNLHAKLFDMPGASLFHDFCDEHITSLPHVLVKGVVRDVTRSASEYEVHVSSGEEKAPTTLKAAKIVFALGAARPVIPPAFASMFSDATREGADKKAANDIIHAGWWEALRDVPWHSRDTVLVIGGGLSAVQAALLAVRRGAGHVVLCSRRPILTQQYDLPLEWMNVRSVAKGAARARLFEFHGTSFDERVAWLREARSGATVPPEYMRQISAAVRDGRLKLVTDTVESISREAQRYRVTFAGGTDTLLVSRAILGTGSELDCTGLELMRKVIDRFSLPIVSGLPVLSDTLQWGDERFVVVGALASLQVGPDAGNLAGARRAAEVCAAELGVFDFLQDRGNPLANLFDVFASDSEDDPTDDEEGGDAEDH